MLIPKNQFMFEICDNTNTYLAGNNPIWWIKAVSVHTTVGFKTTHNSLEDAEKELRGLKIYLRQNHSHVDTDANYTKIV